MNISQTQLANFGTAAGIIVILLSKFGIVFSADSVAFVLASVWSLAWTGYNYYNRFQKGDLTLGGARK